MIVIAILLAIAGALCGLASTAGAIALLVVDRSVLLPWISWGSVGLLFVASIAANYLARVVAKGFRR